MYTREQIIKAIENCLNECEQQIIKTRFGIDDGITVPLDEIESIFKTSREEVHKIERRVLMYVKSHS